MFYFRIFVYQLSVKMVSHRSHTNHEFLLVIRVTIFTNALRFAVESFVTYENVLIMMLHEVT